MGGPADPELIRDLLHGVGPFPIESGRVVHVPGELRLTGAEFGFCPPGAAAGPRRPRARHGYVRTSMRNEGEAAVSTWMSKVAVASITLVCSLGVATAAHASSSTAVSASVPDGSVNVSSQEASGVLFWDWRIENRTSATLAQDGNVTDNTEHGYVEKDWANGEGHPRLRQSSHESCILKYSRPRVRRRQFRARGIETRVLPWRAPPENAVPKPRNGGVQMGWGNRMPDAVIDRRAKRTSTSCSRSVATPAQHRAVRRVTWLQRPS